MSKKKLTRKRKKQLLAMFMATGMMAQSLISTGIVLAEEMEQTNTELQSTNENLPFERASVAIDNEDYVSGKSKYFWDSSTYTLSATPLAYGGDTTYLRNKIYYVSNEENPSAVPGSAKKINPSDAKILGSVKFTTTSQMTMSMSLNTAEQKQLLKQYKYVYEGALSEYVPTIGSTPPANRQATVYARINTSDLVPKTEIGTVIATYVDESGKQVAPTEILNGEVGNKYTTTAKTISGYTLKSIPSNASGTFTSSTQVATYVYKKNPEAGGTVTAKYVDESGKEIAPSVTYNGNVGDKYTTTAKTISGYTLKTTPSNASGTFTSSTQTVTYVYASVNKMEVTVSQPIYEVTKGEKLVIPYTVKNFEGKRGDHFENSNGKLLGVQVSDKEENEYVVDSNRLSTGDYRIRAVDSNSNSSSASFKIIVNEKADGAPVTVKYVDNEGKEVADAETLNGKIGDNYETKAKEIEGYTLKETPENAIGEFTDKEQTVTYVYDKNKVGSDPIIYAEDKTYQVGETLNPLLGVSAKDPEDGDLTDKVKADSSGVNMSKPGTYDLKLSVTDSDNNTTEKTVKVNVVDQINDAPTIKGADDIMIDERSKFEPLKGITAQDSLGKDITENLTYTGSVDTSTPGIYQIKYYAHDSEGRVSTATRKVTVQSENSKPVVMSPDKLTIKKNSKFDPMLYVQAYDLEDGDITDKVIVKGKIFTDKVETQSITYQVTDSDGNTSSKMMEVDVVETLGNAPVISGAEDIELTVGDKFDLISGVTAYDEEDGDLTSEIKYSGVVNTGKPGEYKVIYTVWDSEFNTVSVERTITIKEKEVEAAPVTVKYVDTEGKELAESETLNGKVGDSYETKAKEIDGYVLKETPDNAKGTFTDKEQTVTYVYQVKADYALTANKFIIGKDTYVTGTAGADIGFVDLYVNGVFAKRAQVNADGSYRVYGIAIENKADDVKIVALDTDKKPISPEISAKVSVALLSEENEFKLKANDYTLGEYYITGTYDNDKADRVKLLIDGKVVKQNIIGESASDQFSLSAAGFITGIDDHVYEIAEYNGSTLINRAPITVKEKEVVDYSITAEDYTIGDNTINGTWKGDSNSTHVALKVNGQIVKLTELNSDGTYSLSAKGFITSPDQTIEVVLYNKTTKQIFSSVSPLIKVGVTAETFTIGSDIDIVGTYDSRKTADVDTIRLLEDGVAVKLVRHDALSEEKQDSATEYRLSAKAVVKDRTKNYTVQHLKDGKVYSSTTLAVK